MAEVIAFISSVTAIVQISDRIIGVCKYYIKTARDAPSDLRAILIEVLTMKTIFETQEFLTEHNKELSSVVSSLSGEGGPIEGCRRSITELERLLHQNIVKHGGQGGSQRRKMQSTSAALAWPLKASKARKLLDDIMRHKATVSLALTTDSMYVMSSLYSHACITLLDLHEVCTARLVLRRVGWAPWLRMYSQDIKTIRTKALEIHDMLTGMARVHHRYVQ